MEVLSSILNTLRSNSRDWIGLQGWSVRVSSSAPGSGVTVHNETHLPERYWSTLHAGVFMLTMIFKSPDSQDYIRTMFRNVIVSCVENEFLGANLIDSERPFKTSKFFFEVYPNAGFYWGYGNIGFSSNTGAAVVTGTYHFQGNTLNVSQAYYVGFSLTEPTTQINLNNELTMFYGDRFKGMGLKETLLFQADFADLNMGKRYANPELYLSYGVAAAQSGYSYFVIQGAFPLYNFMADFIRYISPIIKVPNTLTSWFKFASTCDKSAGFTELGAGFTIAKSNEKYCHFAFCHIGFLQNWESLITSFYQQWPLKMYYYYYTTPLVVYPSQSTNKLQVSGIINAAETPMVIPESSFPSAYSEQNLWRYFPKGNLYRASPEYLSGYYINAYYSTWEEMGGYFYSDAIEDPDKPYVPPAPKTDPGPGTPIPDPTPPDPLPQEPVPDPKVWTGTNASFWNTVTNLSIPITTAFAQYPTQSESNVEKMIALRNYTQNETSLAGLRQLMLASLSNSSWTLKEILSSKQVVPYNLHLVPQIIQWYGAMKPAMVTEAGIPASTGASVGGMISDLLKPGTTMKDLLTRYPQDMLTYGTQVLLLAKYFRTGTFP